MNKKKTIVLVAPSYPYRGGQALDEAYLYHIVSSMNMDYHNISYTLLYPKIFFPGKTQFDNSDVIPFEHRHLSKRIINSINPFSWWKAYKAIKDLKPDCVIFLWWMFFFAPCVKTIAFLIRHGLKNTRICFLADNYVSHDNHSWEKTIVKHTFKSADCFVAPSQYIAEQIRKDFPNKTICTTTLSVYDCYNLHRYTKQTARKELKIENKEVILFFGLIRPYKGLLKLLEAMPALLQQRKDLCLLIVGECYQDVSVYSDKIEQLGLGKNVIMYNKYVSNEEIEPFFIASDLVCLPYESATQSGVVMTSYAFRRPVVVTDVGGIKEEVRQGLTGVVVKDNSPANLCEGINTVLDSSSCTDYAQNISDFVDTFANLTLKKFLSEL